MKRSVVAAVLALGVMLLAGAAALASARGDLSPAPGRQAIAAPIDRMAIVIRESSPPQVTLNVTAGLPSGCAQRESYTVTRTGDTFTVSVVNSMPTGSPVCTMIYGTYELNIDLGGDVRPGVTYTVRVNDKATTFRSETR